jgi:polyribonucleotide nucleotidyltransferase
MSIQIEKTLAFIFLLLVLILTWYLFLIDDFVTETEERITGVFASLALGFGIFQFWIQELNEVKRKLYDMRYEAYKDFVLQIESISESLHMELIGDEIGSIHNLLNRLINNLNRINTTIAISSDSLFPGLQSAQETKSILHIVAKILTKTNEFRLKIEKANRQGKEIARDFLQSQDRMRWHNEIGEFLNELHTTKHDFYRILKDHF